MASGGSVDDTPDQHGITQLLAQLFLDRFLPADCRPSVTNFKYWPVASLGEGYTTVRKVLEITYRDEGKENDQFAVFVVKLPGGGFTKEIRRMGLYEREVVMYAEVVEHFRQLLTSARRPATVPFPRFVYGAMMKNGEMLDDRGRRTEDQTLREMIVLELLRDFEVVDKKVGFDLEHMRLVMPAMARFHAVGLVLYRKHPEKVKRLREVKFEFPEGMDLISESMAPIKAALRYEGLTKEAEAMAPLISFEHFKQGYEASFTEDLDVVVLVHGDLWSSNMMFKYGTDESGARHPEEIKFVDLQMPRFGDLAFDIVYCMLTSTRRPLRREHMQEMLGWYEQAFRSQLEALGEDPDQLAPWLSVNRLYAMYGNALYNCCWNAVQLVQLLHASDEDRQLMLTCSSLEEAAAASETVAARWAEGKCSRGVAERLIEIIEDLKEFDLL